MNPLICNGLKPSNCPRWQLCAAAHFRPFASCGFWPRKPDNTFPGWSGDKISPHTGSMISWLFYEAAPLPVPCLTAGQLPGNICRSTIGKCSGRRCGHPIHRPATDNSRCRYCSTHAPIAEQCETVDSLNAVSNLSFSFLSQNLLRKRAVCFLAQTAPWNYSACAFFCFFRSRSRLLRSR